MASGPRAVGKGSATPSGKSPPRQARLVHYVGFRDGPGGIRAANAARIYGPPDMVHSNWDVYAANDVAPDDIVIHADGEWDRPPRSFSTEAARNRRARKANSGTSHG
ncbi:hypothetical protein ACFCW2_02625 [Qipengyuania sp. DSG2-2]|uniref:hypothetical protein n=1 Tax=Qipengyuania sp. DGS2-2 TaxID=3349631 RepID=UPI0036D224EF